LIQQLAFQKYINGSIFVRAIKNGNFLPRNAYRSGLTCNAGSGITRCCHWRPSTLHSTAAATDWI